MLYEPMRQKVHFCVPFLVFNFLEAYYGLMVYDSVGDRQEGFFCQTRFSTKIANIKYLTLEE